MLIFHGFEDCGYIWMLKLYCVSSKIISIKATVLRPQGGRGSEGQKISYCYSERSRWDEKDAEVRIKKYYS